MKGAGLALGPGRPDFAPAVTLVTCNLPESQGAKTVCKAVKIIDVKN